jgi:polyisoprenyl-phosphate glycosyltransferase
MSQPAVAVPAIQPCTLSVVVPLFNEEEVLPVFHDRLVAALAGMPGGWEVVYVDDGSTDNTPKMLEALRGAGTTIAVVRLSRNFGKEAGMSAGLRLARGGAVVVIDADLQDPPELIPQMVSAWRQGADMVNMRRRSRHGETWVKKATARAFYRIINWLSEVDIPPNVGDFRLLSRRAVDALNLLNERNRFTKGLFAWIGYPQVTIEYDRDPRAAGHSKWRYRKLWHFAIEGITGFSMAPLKLATYVGFVSAMGAFVYALKFLIKAAVIGDPVAGFPTLIVSILLLGGLQLMATGILGEYLGRLFIESKQRPLYLIDEYWPATMERLVAVPTRTAVPQALSQIR